MTQITELSREEVIPKLLAEVWHKSQQQIHLNFNKAKITREYFSFSCGHVNLLCFLFSYLSFSHAAIHLSDFWARPGSGGPVGLWPLYFCDFCSRSHDEDSSETAEKSTVQTAGQPPALSAQHDSKVRWNITYSILLMSHGACWCHWGYVVLAQRHWTREIIAFTTEIDQWVLVLVLVSADVLDTWYQFFILIMYPWSVKYASITAESAVFKTDILYFIFISYCVKAK